MYDVAIIGSGVSGGRIAFELSKAGMKCILIEAGTEYSAQTFPDNELDYSTQMFWGGGLEISSDARMAFLRARCVGGTSIVNQALLDRFDDDAWDDWRDRSGVGFLTADEMERHYAACEHELSVSEIPREHWNRNTDIFTGAFDRSGYGWKALRRGQTDCKLDKGSDCIVCLGGCPRNSKQSSLVTTIARAREHGLTVESEFEIERLHYHDDDVRVVGVQRGQERDVTARRVVLAAGGFGNVAILSRSSLRAQLPALGHGFTCHPQYMTYAGFDEEIDAHKGAFQAVKSDDPKLRAQGFKLENVFAGPIGTAMLFPGYGAPHGKLMRRYRNMASMEVAIRDEASGVISLDKNGKLRIDKKLTAADRHKTDTGLKLVRELFEAAGAKEIVSCTDSFGLHLMGGCAIGDDDRTSVVAPDFTVHGHPRLTIADSSVFPSAPGINPSFTVMALSHRASEHVLELDRG